MTYDSDERDAATTAAYIATRESVLSEVFAQTRGGLSMEAEVPKDPCASAVRRVHPRAPLGRAEEAEDAFQGGGRGRGGDVIYGDEG